MLRHGLTWVAIFVVIALMFLRLPTMTARQDVVLNTYGALVEVDALARQQYVEPIEDRRLVDGAIRGMMLQLDPYSGYIAPDELRSFERRSDGDYIGVGVEVGLREGRLTVIAPLEGSPAAKAGILAGDVILSIGGRDARELSVFDAEDRLVGKPGSLVEVVISRGGREEPTAFTLARAPVSIRTVRGFRRDDSGDWDYLIDPAARIGYIRVSNFHENTIRDFDAVLSELQAKNARGLVIDLRFNPGGLMESAIDMVDRFVAEGCIVSTVTRRRLVHDYPAVHAGTIDHLPLAVLINGGSASSAEIVAGSLQDHGRAIIVGERSFGKGSVQHLIPLSNRAAAVKLTVAYYRLPNGRIIHRTAKNAYQETWGVTPDVAVPLDDDDLREIQRSRREIDLAFHESSRSLDGEESPRGDGSEANGRNAGEVVRDGQLLEALSRLVTPGP